MQVYCGTAICAASRASLMTGLHIGHCNVRANRKYIDQSGKENGQTPLPADVTTVGDVLKSAGYATACNGKWGIGNLETTGNPLKHGFDHFYGYIDQWRAHSYFPDYLDNNDQRVPLDGKTYAPELIQQDALKWIRAHAQEPFFLYYAATLPHGNYEIDSLGRYESMPWDKEAKTYAAMVSRLDTYTGQVLDLLHELKLEEKTIVFFVAGDNGPAFPPDSPTAQLFNQATDKQFRGHKATMYEGGVRQGGLVRWPGHVPAGKVSDEPWILYDVMPTCAELAGVKLPANARPDGISVVPGLLGGAMPKRPYFYYELDLPYFMQATRFEDWKAVVPYPGAALELYDLKTDPGEKRDLAAEHPDLVAKAKGILKEAHTDLPDWPIKEKKAATKPAK
jgi:arylsulfatase A-like enzyme